MLDGELEYFPTAHGYRYENRPYFIAIPLSFQLSPFFNSTGDQSICLFWIIWENFYIERLSVYSIVKQPQ